MTPNAELAYLVLDHIDAHPEQWDQETWWDERAEIWTDDEGNPHCGTAGCFAGLACALSGERPVFDDDLGEVAVNGVVVAARAAELLGLYSRQQMDDAILPRMLGSLFAPRNSRDDLGRIVAETFGPRPGGES